MASRLEAGACGAKIASAVTLGDLAAGECHYSALRLAGAEEHASNLTRNGLARELLDEGLAGALRNGGIRRGKASGCVHRAAITLLSTTKSGVLVAAAGLDAAEEVCTTERGGDRAAKRW